MKRIKIDKFKSPDKRSHRTKDKLYQVYLGNGEREYFTSEKQVKEYLSHINQQLTDISFELNEIYIEVFRHYRQCYFHVDTKRFPVIIAGIEKAFYLAFTRAGFDNGNYFVYVHLKNIADALLQMCRIIMRLNQEKKYYPTVQIMKSLVKRINNILPDLENYNN